MKTEFLVFYLCTVCLLAFGPAPVVTGQDVLAQEEILHGQLGVFVKPSLSAVSTVELGTDLAHSFADVGIALGLGAGYGLSDHFSVIGGIIYAPGLTGISSRDYSIRQFDLGLRIAFGPPSNRTRFILDAGVSHRVVQFGMSFDRTREVSGPAITSGFGWQYIIGEKLRLNWTLGGTYGKWRDLKIDGQPVTDSYRDLTLFSFRLMVGLSWWL